MQTEIHANWDRASESSLVYINYCSLIQKLFELLFTTFKDFFKLIELFKAILSILGCRDGVWAFESSAIGISSSVGLKAIIVAVSGSVVALVEAVMEISGSSSNSTTAVSCRGRRPSLIGLQRFSADGAERFRAEITFPAGSLVLRSSADFFRRWTAPAPAEVAAPIEFSADPSSAVGSLLMLLIDSMLDNSKSTAASEFVASAGIFLPNANPRRCEVFLLHFDNDSKIIPNFNFLILRKFKTKLCLNT